MTSDDPKFKIITVVSIVLLLSLMAIYDARKKDLVQNHINDERLKLEKTVSDHEKAKLQIEMLRLKNSELEKSVMEVSKKPN